MNGGGRSLNTPETKTSAFFVILGLIIGFIWGALAVVVVMP